MNINRLIITIVLASLISLFSFEFSYSAHFDPQKTAAKVKEVVDKTRPGFSVSDKDRNPSPGTTSSIIENVDTLAKELAPLYWDILRAQSETMHKEPNSYNPYTLPLRWVSGSISGMGMWHIPHVKTFKEAIKCMFDQGTNWKETHYRKETRTRTKIDSSQTPPVEVTESYEELVPYEVPKQGYTGDKPYLSWLLEKLENSADPEKDFPYIMLALHFVKAYDLPKALQQNPYTVFQSCDSSTLGNPSLATRYNTLENALKTKWKEEWQVATFAEKFISRCTLEMGLYRIDPFVHNIGEILKELGNISPETRSKHEGLINSVLGAFAKQISAIKEQVGKDAKVKELLQKLCTPQDPNKYKMMVDSHEHFSIFYDIRSMLTKSADYPELVYNMVDQLLTVLKDDVFKEQELPAVWNNIVEQVKTAKTTGVYKPFVASTEGGKSQLVSNANEIGNKVTQLQSTKSTTPISGLITNLAQLYAYRANISQLEEAVTTNEGIAALDKASNEINEAIQAFETTIKEGFQGGEETYPDLPLPQAIKQAIESLPGKEQAVKDFGQFIRQLPQTTDQKFSLIKARAAKQGTDANWSNLEIPEWNKHPLAELLFFYKTKAELTTLDTTKLRSKKDEYDQYLGWVNSQIEDIEKDKNLTLKGKNVQEFLNAAKQHLTSYDGALKDVLHIFNVLEKGKVIDNPKPIKAWFEQNKASMQGQPDDQIAPLNRLVEQAEKLPDTSGSGHESDNLDVDNSAARVLKVGAVVIVASATARMLYKRFYKPKKQPTKPEQEELSELHEELETNTDANQEGPSKKRKKQLPHGALK